MSSDIRVKAKKREDVGTSAVKRLRKTGWIPAVVYGESKETQSIQVEEHAFELMLSRHGSESMMMELDIEGGEKAQVLLRAVQHHPVDAHVLHIDFLSVDMNKKLTVAIPVEVTGTPIGVTTGGVLDQSLWEVEVECYPGDIVEQLVLDVSGLEIGDTLTVADMKIDTDKYSVVTDGEIAIASVIQPRVIEEETDGEEVAVAAGEPEVIGEKQEEQE